MPRKLTLPLVDNLWGCPASSSVKQQSKARNRVALGPANSKAPERLPFPLCAHSTPRSTPEGHLGRAPQTTQQAAEFRKNVWGWALGPPWWRERK